MDPLVISIVALAIPMILVPTILVIRHARLERELEHAERMKALEVGRTLPQDEPRWTPALICVAIGAGVPIGVFGMAFLASSTIRDTQPVWVSAGFVGVAGVLGGTFLAGRYFTQFAQPKASAHVKPDVDADAFDVAGQRGGSYQTQSQQA
jgi:hypothetical protein